MLEGQNSIVISGTLLYVASGLLTFIGILTYYIWRQRNMQINCQFSKVRESLKDNREDHIRIHERIDSALERE